jgi:hypothetical protein
MNNLSYESKYLKYKKKYLELKKKLHGGESNYIDKFISANTDKNDYWDNRINKFDLGSDKKLYALFCNEKYATKQGIEFKENKNAPSIDNLNKKLSGNCFVLENNQNQCFLIIDKDIPQRSVNGKFHGLKLFMLFPQPQNFGTKDNIDENIIMCILNKFITSSEYKLRYKDENRNFIENSVDCCIIIEISKLFSNKFIKIFKKTPT